MSDKRLRSIDDKGEVTRRQPEKAGAAVAAAERIEARADEALAELLTDLAMAPAEDCRTPNMGQTAGGDAQHNVKQASRDTANLTMEANAHLKSSSR